MHYDKENANGRIYTRDVCAEMLAEAQDQIRKGNMLGELGQPDRPEVALANISHKVTDVWMDESTKTLQGRLEILDTPQGDNLREMLSHDIPFSVASRGIGIVDPETHEVTDYTFFSFDIIPSAQSATNGYLKIDEI